MRTLHTCYVGSGLICLLAGLQHVAEPVSAPVPPVPTARRPAFAAVLSIVIIVIVVAVVGAGRSVGALLGAPLEAQQVVHVDVSQRVHRRSR